MALFLSLSAIRAASADEVGSKTMALAELDAAGPRAGGTPGERPCYA